MRISSSQKWLYTHGRNKWETHYSSDALEWQESFFDHFLKGEDNEFEQRPRVRLEVRRNKVDFEVRAESTWPPECAIFTKLCLDLEQARLSRDAPDQQQTRVYDAESEVERQVSIVPHYIRSSYNNTLV